VRRFMRLQPVAMRLEMKAGVRNNLLINDAYNSDLESLKVALNFLDQQASDRKKILVLSDIHQTGLLPGELYRKVFDIISLHNINCLIGVGEEICRYASFFTGQGFFFKGTEGFLSSLIEYSWENSAS